MFSTLCIVPSLISNYIYLQEVLDHGDVKIMEEQLANAIESIVVSFLYIIHEYETII